MSDPTPQTSPLTSAAEKARGLPLAILGINEVGGWREILVDLSALALRVAAADPREADLESLRAGRPASSAQQAKRRPFSPLAFLENPLAANFTQELGRALQKGIREAGGSNAEPRRAIMEAAPDSSGMALKVQTHPFLHMTLLLKSDPPAPEGALSAWARACEAVELMPASEPAFSRMQARASLLSEGSRGALVSALERIGFERAIETPEPDQGRRRSLRP